jgi:hypothetical protein
MLRPTYSKAIYVAPLLLLATARSWAAESVNHAAVLAPFVNDDTFLVAHVDIASLKVSENSGELWQVLPKLSGDAQVWIAGAMMVDGLARQFQQAGGQSIYVVAGLGDAHIGGGPVILATVRSGHRPQEIERLFHDMIPQIIAYPRQMSDDAFAKQITVQQRGDAVLVGTKSSVARYASLKPAARNDLIAPLTKLSGEGALAAAVFCPGPDSRRVVRELWPNLPGSLEPLRGEMADRWLHLEAAVNLPPDAKPRLALEARDADAAELFAKLWRNLPMETTEFGGNANAREQVKGYAQLLVDLLPAKVDGTRITIAMPTDESHIAKLRKIFSDASNAAMESSRRQTRAARFHNIVIGMLNFESARKHLPPAAICDKNGRPLLSWRVAILPYLEEQDLYKEFHLDEPWDSPHNKSLIEKMPGVYMGVGLKFDQLNRAGKTVCQAPVGPKTIFFNNVGTTIREITDGTSATIVLVEVKPRRAVAWTKPEDWAVDLEHPRRGVERTDGGPFVAAWCDGSVHLIPSNADEVQFRALLTRSGQEIVHPNF